MQLNKVHKLQKVTGVIIAACGSSHCSTNICKVQWHTDPGSTRACSSGPVPGKVKDPVSADRLSSAVPEAACARSSASKTPLPASSHRAPPSRVSSAAAALAAAPRKAIARSLHGRQNASSFGRLARLGCRPGAYGCPFLKVHASISEVPLQHASTGPI